MASVYKPAGRKRYVINYRDEHGRLRKKTGYTDKRETERLAQRLEETARKVRDGLTTRGEMTITSRLRESIEAHIDAYRKFLLDSDATPKHADLARNRLRKLLRSAGRGPCGRTGRRAGSGHRRPRGMGPDRSDRMTARSTTDRSASWTRIPRRPRPGGSGPAHETTDPITRRTRQTGWTEPAR